MLAPTNEDIYRKWVSLYVRRVNPYLAYGCVNRKVERLGIKAAIRGGPRTRSFAKKTHHPSHHHGGRNWKAGHAQRAKRKQTVVNTMENVNILTGTGSAIGYYPSVLAHTIRIPNSE